MTPPDLPRERDVVFAPGVARAEVDLYRNVIALA